MTLRSINPHGGAVIATYPTHSVQELDERLTAAAFAQAHWRRQPPAERAEHLRRIAASLRRHADELATIATIETGKPITAARAEVEKCAACCEWYAGQTALLASQAGPLPGDAIRLEPLGVILAIMPWNFPYWQVVRVLAPALLLGNTILLKHANNVTGCALALDGAIRDAGDVAGLLSVLLITIDQVNQTIADPRVAAVTITGSERAGAAVAAAAGAALKPAVLELGGSDPFLVWHDVDVDVVARAAARARCVNGGQSCIAAKRFLVHDAVYDRFLQAFTVAMRALKVSDPRALDTDIGPLISIDARDALHAQVQATLDAGAVARLGCVNPGGATAWYPPSIVTGIPDASPMAVDELFGPVAGVWRIRDIEDAIDRANSTRFGLGASVWTHDPVVARRCAEDFRAGSVMINQAVASDPALPFGGIRASGYGRELGYAGLTAFANIKTVRGLSV